MALTANDIFELEAKVRLHADRLRREWPDDATVGPAVQSHARSMRAEAKAFDQIGDLLMGLQGDWPSFGPRVRAGFTLMTKFHDARKARVPAKPEIDEAAA